MKSIIVFFLLVFSIQLNAESYLDSCFISVQNNDFDKAIEYYYKAEDQKESLNHPATIFMADIFYKKKAKVLAFGLYKQYFNSALTEKEKKKITKRIEKLRTDVSDIKLIYNKLLKEDYYDFEMLVELKAIEVIDPMSYNTFSALIPFAINKKFSKTTLYLYNLSMSLNPYQSTLILEVLPKWAAFDFKNAEIALNKLKSEIPNDQYLKTSFKLYKEKKDLDKCLNILDDIHKDSMYNDIYITDKYHLIQSLGTNLMLNEFLVKASIEESGILAKSSLAARAYKQGNFKEAEAYYNKLSEFQPTNPEWPFWAAMSVRRTIPGYRKGWYSQENRLVLKYLNQAIDLDSNNAEYLNYAAETCNNIDAKDTAIVYVEKALSIDSLNFAYYKTYFLIMMWYSVEGKNKMIRQKANKGIELFKKLHDEDPNNATVTFALATFNAEIASTLSPSSAAKYDSKIIEYAEKTFAIDTSDYYKYFDIAVELTRMSAYTDQYDEYDLHLDRRAINWFPEHQQPLYSAFWTCFHDNNFDEADKYQALFIKKFPNTHRAEQILKAIKKEKSYKWTGIH